MVSLKSVEKQLKTIKFNPTAWGKAEIKELPNILMDDERISECVNGSYEGGFALLCATNIRLLLVDKKPLKFLTVEDLRFDMINQIDYSHRLMGARINVSTGVKNLRFTSFNQQRLRKLINHIQHRMAEVKMEQSSSAETQQQHLERINQQLQTYLRAQHEQQEELTRKLEEPGNKGASSPSNGVISEPVRPAPELADFLYAQSLMQQYQAGNLHAATIPAAAPPTAPMPAASVAPTLSIVPPTPTFAAPAAVAPIAPVAKPRTSSIDIDSLVEAGRREIFGAKSKAMAMVKPLQTPLNYIGTEVHPLRIAYGKLPTLLRSRKFSNLSRNYNAPTMPPIIPGTTGPART